MFIPYTYVLTHLPTGKRYYGVRYSKKANPSDLWVTYFSSSRLVKALPREEFKAEIRKTFATAEEALRWEQQVIKRLRLDLNQEWFNQHYIGSKFKPTVITPEHRAKIAAANRGKKRSQEIRERMRWTPEMRSRWLVANKNRPPMSEETKRKIAEANIGKKMDRSIAEKIGEAHKGKKRSEETKAKMRAAWEARRSKYGPNGRHTKEVE